MTMVANGVHIIPNNILDKSNISSAIKPSTV
ncbi:hypothetical protein RO3G_05588 [Rhizopus delemar RA 99-880]|uniref:Uncharacterized protein n=1 Tax=Rhizopus delemar (strain RA 99-880 / ATCC MYA-4621 / FGSC 9543 / NRRL 43880) TaxID=246409 RepID=I1BXF3_RHIO9|nr:hypothetical protein RO3G_05588 [Rhizopus delemar RA 99-880]|eukprot:EIE80883.1 hypothetical protein RO3G_05588 [Rhizopus delemar RA 99-880]